MLESRQMLAANPFHNAALPCDVNADGATTVNDLRILYTDLSVNGAHALAPLAPSGGEGEGANGTQYVDINADGMLTMADLRQLLATLSPPAESESSMQLEVFIDFKDTNGNIITSANVGDTIIVDVDFQDARDPLARNPDNSLMFPGLNQTVLNMGVFSAYFDFAHSSNLINAAAPNQFLANADFLTGVPTATDQYNHHAEPLVGGAAQLTSFSAFNKDAVKPTVVNVFTEFEIESTSNGTAVLTLANVPANLTAGFAVRGAGVPAGTKVTAVNTLASTVTVSNPVPTGTSLLTYTLDETVINDLGGAARAQNQDNRTNFLEINFTITGTDLTANDDVAQTDELTAVDIPVLANDRVTSEIFVERRTAEALGSETAFFRGGTPNVVEEDHLSQITPDEIFGDQLVTLPVNNVAIGGLQVVSVTAGAGTAIVVGDQIRFTPSATAPGTVEIVYSINDGQGGNAQATATVSVGSNNDAPTHTTPALSGNEEQPIALTGVTVSDTDAGTGQLTTTLTAHNGTLAGNNNGTPVSGVSTVTINGTLAQINSSLATFTFTGNLNFVGLELLDISTNDNGNTGDGGAQTTADTISITVNDVNDAPVLTVPGGQTVADDDQLAFAGTISVSDVDSPTMTITLGLSSLTGASGQIGVLSIGNASGANVTGNNSESVTISGALAAVNAALASLSYVPDGLSGFLGTVTIDVTANDGESGTDAESVDVVVEAGVLPRARRDSLTVAEDSGNHTIDVLFNDLPTDPQISAVTLESFTQPANGTVTRSDPNNTPADLTDDLLIYRPNDDFAGLDSFTYVIDETPNQGGIPSTGVVSINVTEINDNPTAADLTVAFDEDEVISAADFSNLLASLVTTPGGGADEAGQSVNVTSVTALNAGATVTLTSLTLDANYNNNINGPFRFQYVVTDNGTTNGVANPLPATATVTVNINAVNDAPETTNDGPLTTDRNGQTVTEDTDATFSAAALLTNDDPGPASASDEAGQTVVFNGLVSGTTSAGGTITQNGDDLIYSPPQDFNGTDTFTYTINDQQLQNNISVPGIVTISVAAVNDAPIANEDGLNDEFDGVKDTPLTIALSALLTNDAPGPDTATDEAGQPLSVTAVQNNPTGNGTVTLDGNGNFVYTPNPGFSGDDTFTYTLSDGQSQNSTDTGTVTIHVADFLPSSFSGFVYVDTNVDSTMNAVEQVLGGVEITLTGTTSNGTVLSPLTVTTDSNGFYSFANLTPGSYNITQSQPAFFNDGAETPGTGSTVAANDVFSFVVGSAGGVNSENNNFAELGLLPTYFSIAELRASLPSSGSVIGCNADGDALWFSLLGSWGSMDAEASVSASVSTDMRTLQLTLHHGNGSPDSVQTINLETSTRVRVMGSDGTGGHVIRIEGNVSDLFAAAEGEAPMAEGEMSLEDSIDTVARGHSASDVDEVFSLLG
ncbi:MAG: tandem-95 repeat protein [Planctomycetales bacterium]|nr:tandem-95 repeat protein [Planctomycetales bacterium]